MMRRNTFLFWCYFFCSITNLTLSANDEISRVTNDEQAKLWLKKYGYLNCEELTQNTLYDILTTGTPHPGSNDITTATLSSVYSSQPQSSHHISTTVSPRPETTLDPNTAIFEEGVSEITDDAPQVTQPRSTQTKRPCSNELYIDALKSYQRHYGLTVSGRLDVMTKRNMGEMRCGNSDNEMLTSDTPEKSSPDYAVDENEASVPPSRAKTLLRRVIRSIENEKLSTVRQRFIDNYIQKPEMELSEDNDDKRLIHFRRRKRSAVINEDLSTDVKFGKTVIRWRLLKSAFSSRIPIGVQRATIALAFRMWSEVTPLYFIEDNFCDINDIDVEIAFAKRFHLDCPHVFDGQGGELAHSWHGGNIHVDDETPFRSQDTDGVSLLKVAVHEIGHVLGLAHTQQISSVMHAVYANLRPLTQFELSDFDRRSVRSIYGVCRGHFDVIFDWLRKRPNGRYVYNTFILRKTHMWVYLNSRNRTRFGDPVQLTDEWKDLPTTLDTMALVFYFNRLERGYVHDAFFFSRDNYYVYDLAKGKIADGYPKKIRDGFHAKDSSSRPVPDNLDASLFDQRDRNIYFFKGEQVYVYNPKGYGCCDKVVKFKDQFPTMPGSIELTGNIDAAYYTFNKHKQYFFKGENVWVNERFSPRGRASDNQLRYLGKWYHRWLDVCDVDPSH